MLLSKFICRSLGEVYVHCVSPWMSCLVHAIHADMSGAILSSETNNQTEILAFCSGLGLEQINSLSNMNKTGLK